MTSSLKMFYMSASLRRESVSSQLNYTLCSTFLMPQAVVTDMKNLLVFKLESLYKI